MTSTLKRRPKNFQHKSLNTLEGSVYKDEIFEEEDTLEEITEWENKHIDLEERTNIYEAVEENFCELYESVNPLYREMFLLRDYKICVIPEMIFILKAEIQFVKLIKKIYYYKCYLIQIEKAFFY